MSTIDEMDQVRSDVGVAARNDTVVNHTVVHAHGRNTQGRMVEAQGGL